MKIIKKYHFYAAHRNKCAGEKCGRLHGHTYHVKVHLEFPKWKKDVSILFQEIDKKCENVLKLYDHFLLLYISDPLASVLYDADEPFHPLPFETSAENMAKHLYHQIEETGLPISRLELAETESSNIIYEPTN
ncbi:MAG: putative 6-carboxy-5 6 7 8-tetrahydropterin synthase [Prokaryotic dsDNA virus sp.]|nr:MAG: putative 6-carboxy-5 6 7 8-tetrahydropterin synthase [Prokaryotic dsDNA virus sp.]